MQIRDASKPSSSCDSRQSVLTPLTNPALLPKLSRSLSRFGMKFLNLSSKERPALPFSPWLGRSPVTRKAHRQPKPWIASAIVTSVASIGFAGSAHAALTLDKTSGSWSNVVGGTNINFNSVGNESVVLWGVPVGTEQSGLGFTGRDYVPDLEPGPSEFKLGTLTHYNFVVDGGTAASGAELDVLINLSSPASVVNFNYNMAIDETTNQQPCTYPGSSICPDKISISPFSQNFVYQGGTYSLDAFFKDGLGNPVDFIITEENQATPVDLWGRVTLISPPPPTSVPSPLPLFGAAAAFQASRKLKSRIAAGRRAQAPCTQTRNW
jgi:hypothetical protein